MRVKTRGNPVQNLCPRLNLVHFLHNADDAFAAIPGKVAHEFLDVGIVALLNDLFRKADERCLVLQCPCQRGTGVAAGMFAKEWKLIHDGSPFLRMLCMFNGKLLSDTERFFVQRNQMMMTFRQYFI